MGYPLVVTLTFVFATSLLCVGVCAGDTQCRNGTNFISTDAIELSQSLSKAEGALLLLLGFGSLSVILAILYNLIRRFIFQDVNNVDSSFDAGGNVSTSLTAVTVASQLLWPGDLMQSVTMCVKYGIAGGLWYCSSAIVIMSFFPLLSFKFKTRAPGAKTYLQIIKARFGSPTHIIFICFALGVNCIILASIFIGGIAVLQATISDASPEFCVLVIATLCGSYALIGGLGSTFYVSYFNAVATFLVLSLIAFKVLYSDSQPFGSVDDIYNGANCQPGVEGNRDGSRFTFLSENSIIFAVQGLFLVSSVTYCDQASWQSRIAAKPLQGALGFLLGTFLWFSVPASIGIVAGISYVSEVARNQSLALSIQQIDSGVVSAYMSEKAMGSQGGIMMLTMLTMLTMSTGSGEIMGITSIIIYDIYQTYLRPFRRNLPSNHCLCCGLAKKTEAQELSTISNPQNVTSPRNSKCECPPVQKCRYCEQDKKELNADKSSAKLAQYKCPYHKALRTYQDSLVGFKSWCVLWVSLGLIPFALSLHAVELDLNWFMLTGILFTVPAVPEVILSIAWVKTTAKGMVIGSISGLAVGMLLNVLVCTFKYEWDEGFIRTTSKPYAVLAGAGCGFLVSLGLVVLVSLATHDVRSQGDVDAEWQKLRDIDNPLHPWSSHYAEEFPQASDGIRRPTANEMEHSSRHGKYASVVGSIVFVSIFMITIPASLASLEVLSSDDFKVWSYAVTITLFISTVAIIVVTPFEEIRAIITQVRKRKYQSLSQNVQEQIHTKEDTHL